MWYVKIVPSEMAVEAGAKEHIVVIESENCQDLFKWRAEWKWSTVEKLMAVNLIERVEIDYKPGGLV